MAPRPLDPTVVVKGLTPRDLIAGRYEVLAPLGQGGMGLVWRVRDRELDEEVALKLLRPDVAGEDALQRFRREVKLARRVTHPNVARTYDFGVDGELRYFTMELITGESLGDRLQRPLPLAEALRIVAEAARGLAAAHAQGVVHRDLKPDNIMLAGDRTVITDFGIARAQSDGLTSGGIVGTPGYMAPEQLQSAPIDGRTDVYALGVLLFEVLTGKLPFHGDSPFAIAAARLSVPPPDPRSVVATVPAPLAQLVLHTLALKREDRPDAQMVAERLDQFRGGNAPRAAVATPTGHLELPSGTGTPSVRLLPLEANAESAALCADLTKALGDALITQRGVRVVTEGGDLLVGGEVRTAAGKARVRLRLTTPAGAGLWSTHLDGELLDPFGLEDRVVTCVREALEARTLLRRGPADPALHERWEAARKLVARFDPRAVREAIGALEGMLVEHPGEPSCSSLLALALVRLWQQTGAADGSLAARAEELALRALDADPTRADGYQVIASLRTSMGDFRAALRAARDAMARAPLFSEPRGLLGKLLCEAGHVSDGLHQLALALRLEPGAPTMMSDHARVLALLGEEARARTELAAASAAGLGIAMLPLETRLSVWWSDKAMAASCVARMEAARTGAAWERAVPLMRALAEGRYLGEEARTIFTSLMGGTTSPRQLALMRQTSGEYFAASGQVQWALEEVEALAQNPAFIDLLWLDRCAPLNAIRSEPRFAVARAAVAERVTQVFA